MKEVIRTFFLTLSVERNDLALGQQLIGILGLLLNIVQDNVTNEEGEEGAGGGSSSSFQTSPFMRVLGYELFSGFEDLTEEEREGLAIWCSCSNQDISFEAQTLMDRLEALWKG